LLNAYIYEKNSSETITIVFLFFNISQEFYLRRKFTKKNFLTCFDLHCTLGSVLLGQYNMSKYGVQLKHQRASVWKPIFTCYLKIFCNWYQMLFLFDVLFQILKYIKEYISSALKIKIWWQDVLCWSLRDNGLHPQPRMVKVVRKLQEKQFLEKNQEIRISEILYRKKCHWKYSP